MKLFDTHKILNALTISLGAIAALAAIFLVLTGVDYFQKRNLAALLIEANHDSILIRDNRTVISSFERARQSGFERITLRDRAGQELFSVSDSANRASIPVRLSLAVDKQMPSAGTVEFTIDASQSVGATLVLWFFFLGFLMFYVERIRRRMKREFDLELARQRAEATLSIAKQVAHDIRSPLAALDMGLKDVSGLRGDQRVILRHAISRIRDIANDLLKRSDSELVASGVGAQLLLPIIESIVSEKRLQFRDSKGFALDTEFDQGSALSCAVVDPKELKRIISNLVNNSKEAFAEKVTIKLTQTNDFVIIELADDGQGILSEVLQRIGREQVSYGKSGAESGAGLGLLHARSSIERWGGRFKIESEVKKGTTIALSLPKTDPPKWLASELTILNKVLVVVDDEPSIHELWKQRIASFNDVKCYFFVNPISFLDWYETQQLKALFVVDFEFSGLKINGMNVIEKCGISSSSVLVTSRYEETEIQNRCRLLKVKLLPKAMAPYVPLAMYSEYIVLIDDDQLVQRVWKMAAKANDKEILCFSSHSEFLEKCKDIPFSASIYIDSNLANGVKGEVVGKEIFNLGYKSIFLTTGMNPESFSSIYWVKGVIGKEPPWLS